MRISKPPAVRVDTDAIALGRGLDLVSSDLDARPGSLRVAINVQCSLKGGLSRVDGIERFDGRAAPNLATYTMVRLAAAPAGVVLGDALNGLSSGATGTVIYLSGTLVGMTRVSGTFTQGETLRKATTALGTIADAAPSVDGAIDNQLYALAAAEYRVSIAKVPGEGPVRGIEILGSTIYAWRDNVGATAMVLHKATTTGWQAVALLWEVSFSAGSAVYAEGSTLSKGGVTATVKRVVLESGSWSGGTAAGRLIITAPVGGNFTAGAATGGGACTLAGAASQITLAAGGTVRCDQANLTASLNTLRLYGCDGVNREFELGQDDVLVPLTTGMGSIRATAVREHKKHIFFGYRGAIQHSSLGLPYQFTPLTGAAELGTGDIISDMIPVGGSEDAGAMMVLCADSIFVLYGNSSADWKLTRLSRTSGCTARTAVEIGSVLALDKPGIQNYQATQSYGNFAWSSASTRISQIVAGADALFALFIPTESRYLLFMSDGTTISGLVTPGKEIEWTTLSYGRRMVCGISREVAGTQRTFCGDDQGWVYELGVGRSFAGDEIAWAAMLTPSHQRSPSIVKRYRNGMLEVEPASACEIRVGAEFAEVDEDVEPQGPTAIWQPGVGLRWDVSAWDVSYWDTPSRARRAVAIEGDGTSVAVSLSGSSTSELSCLLRAMLINHSPMRQVRF